MFHDKGYSFKLAHLISRRAKLGQYAEIASIMFLRSILPEHIRIDLLGTGHGTDIKLVNRETGKVLCIEVKIARQNIDGKYRATTYKKDHTDARKHSDIVLFWVLPPHADDATPFIIPTLELGSKTFICVTSHPETYEGKWTQFRRAVQHIQAFA